jgi:hypothetical protein
VSHLLPGEGTADLTFRDVDCCRVFSGRGTPRSALACIKFLVGGAVSGRSRSEAVIRGDSGGGRVGYRMQHRERSAGAALIGNRLLIGAAITRG